MLDHHIQQTILYRLAFSEGLKFTELKPGTLDNKLFTYHLHKVITAGYIHKTVKGDYMLTPLGRQLGIRMVDKQQTLATVPDSVLFMVIRRSIDDAWLLYRRKTHPLRSQVGFMHCLPAVDGGAEQTAQDKCLRKTGLSGDFKSLGGGYLRIYHETELESFTHFTLLYCDDIVGELAQDDEYADYFWAQSPDFSGAEFFPSTLALLEKYQAKEPFYMENTFKI